VATVPGILLVPVMEASKREYEFVMSFQAGDYKKGADSMLEALALNEIVEAEFGCKSCCFSATASCVIRGLNLLVLCTVIVCW